MMPYPPTIEALMKKLYESLSEKDRRHYAAIEAVKLGHGGQSYIAGVVGCSRNTVAEGLRELAGQVGGSGDEQRVRQKGGGRKPYRDTYPAIDDQFLEVVADHT